MSTMDSGLMKIRQCSFISGARYTVLVGWREQGRLAGQAVMGKGFWIIVMIDLPQNFNL